MTNELIATEVMKWFRACGIWMDGKETQYFDLPDFLNDMTAAMMVVEKMNDNGFYFKTERRVIDKQYEVLFVKPFDKKPRVPVEDKSYATAICRAALSALNITH